MNTFRVVPRIHTAERLSVFLDTFRLGERDLLLTDRCLYEAYFAGRGLRCIVQDDYGPGEPAEDKVDAIRHEAARAPYDRVVAVGGGTVLDIAKLLALADWTACAPLFRREVPLRRDKGLLLVPTTCGTGSEVTNVVVVAFPSLGAKLGLAAEELYADDAVLLPALLDGLPRRVFLLSSIDALIHAVESYLSPKAGALSRSFSTQAIAAMLSGYRRIAAEGEAARQALHGDFLMASTQAGVAFSNAGCGLIHAMSYPLSGAYHLAHGEANYELFLAVLRFYAARETDGTLTRLTDLLAAGLDCPSAAAIDRLETLLSTLLPRRPLAELGMTAACAPHFAAQVVAEQQRLLANSYIPVETGDIAQLYTELL